MKRIVLPTDFSDNSWSSIVYALKLYADEGCVFYLLNSVSPNSSTMASFSSKLLEIMKVDALKELKELKNQIEIVNVNANHEFQTVLSSKDLEDAIKALVNKQQIDLVIMGTKGATKAKEILFGSNTVKVFNNMRLCPVLVIPEEHDFVIPKQIAFPTDFNRFYKNDELKQLKELATLFNSKIRIVHINVEKQLNVIQEKNLKILKDQLIDFECSFHWMPNYTKKTKEINVFIEELKIEMLTMVNYKHSFIENILKEPVIKKIGFHPIVPFLVIPG